MPDELTDAGAETGSGISQPMVSVVMPVYNAERYLARAVESILNQSFRDFELLAFDDGSTDFSLAILRQYAASDERVVFRAHRHSGYAPLLNEGLHMARGRYLARMDADDIALATRFEMQLEYLEKHPECVAVGGQFVLIDADGDPIGRCRMPLSHQGIEAVHFRGRGSQIAHPALMARSTALRSIGGYRESFEPAEDFDLLLRLGEIGELANLSADVLHYRVHVKQSSCTRRQEQRKNVRLALTEALHRRQLSDLPEPEPWSDQVLSRAELHARWAQWALDAGYYRAARKHSLHSLVRKPYSLYAHRLLFHSLTLRWRRQVRQHDRT